LIEGEQHAQFALAVACNWSLNAGIAPLKSLPSTVSGTLMPCSTTVARVSALPATHSEPASGGNTPG